MSDILIPQMQPLFEAEEKEAVCSYMENVGFITEYKLTERFEKLICEVTGARHSVVVNNGTISLSIIGMALGITFGDEVIVPNYTMIATANAFRMIGATPVFCEVEPQTLCIDINELKKIINPKTKAVVLMLANGRHPTYDIEELKKICETHNLFLIEDAAQALGSFYPTRVHMGCEGVAGSFSFSAPKIISTGQGGAIVTNDTEVFRRIKLLKDFGRSSGGNDIHDTIGYNFKFTELQAAVGIAQIQKLSDRVQRKKQIYDLYRRELTCLGDVHQFYHDVEYTVPWFYDFMFPDRNNLIEFLAANGIQTRKMYGPINDQNAYRTLGKFPVCKAVGEMGLWLPSSVQLTDQQILFICDKIRKFYGK